MLTYADVIVREVIAWQGMCVSVRLCVNVFVSKRVDVLLFLNNCLFIVSVSNGALSRSKCVGAEREPRGPTN
jgi:hypothetical protein